MYATLILIGIAIVSILIAVIIFCESNCERVIIYHNYSVSILGHLSQFYFQANWVSYNDSKQSLARSKYLLNISQSNSQSLQAQINNNE